MATLSPFSNSHQDCFGRYRSGLFYDCNPNEDVYSARRQVRKRQTRPLIQKIFQREVYQSLWLDFVATLCERSMGSTKKSVDDKVGN
jgi:hypothetical protein